MSQATSATGRLDTFLRIKSIKVSQLLDMVGELSLAATSVINHPELKVLEGEGFGQAAHNLETLIRELQDLSSSLRLVPIGGTFKRIQRLVRDLAQQTGKPVELTLKGSDTELDKVLVDQLYDPLMHLVRNAVDHGLEEPEARLAAAKPEKGQLTLSAVQQGREIHITVSDDGQGLNRKRILAQAKQQGLVGPEEEPDDATVWNYIFHSGFSTAETVSNLSGRGVGMDVVYSAVRALRGRISVDSQPRQGSQITLHIPLTLAFLDSMVVRSQNQLYTLPIDAVNEVIKLESEDLTYASADDIEMLRVRDELVPLCRLHQFYQQQKTDYALDEPIVVVVNTSHGPLGLPIDEVIGQEQVTMKPLEGQLKDIRAGVGCVLLGSGEIAIALDSEELSQELYRHGYRSGEKV